MQTVSPLLPQIGMWEALLGLFVFLSPNIIAVIQQPKWNHWQRLTAYIGFHFLTALVYCGAAGRFDVTNIVGTLTTILPLAIASYTGAWKPLADKIELETSPPLDTLTNPNVFSAPVPGQVERQTYGLENSLVTYYKNGKAEPKN